MGMPEHIECVAPIGCWVLHGAVENFIGNGFACIRLVVALESSAEESVAVELLIQPAVEDQRSLLRSRTHPWQYASGCRLFPLGPPSGH